MRRSKRCRMAALVILPILTVVALSGLVISAFPNLRSGSETLKFGDVSGVYSSGLMSISPSDTSYVKLRLINFSNPECKAQIFASSTKPLIRVQAFMNTVTLKPISGVSRTGCNYLNYSEPIYLLPNSSLTYQLSSKNYTQLCLFKSRRNYNQFLIGKGYNFLQSVKNTDLVSFNITEASLYYVAIETNSSATVSIDITVNRYYYDTSKLKNLSTSDCNNPLLPGSSCQIKLCDGYLTCNHAMNYYLTVQSTEPVILEFTSFQTYLLSLTNRKTLFLSIIISYLVLFLGIIVCLICSSRCSTRQKGIYTLIVISML